MTTTTVSTTPGAGDAGEPPSRRNVQELPSSLLRAITDRGSHPRSTLGAYLSLVPDKVWLIPAVWALLAIRHLPVWAIPLLTGHLLDLLDRGGGQAVQALWWALPAAFALCFGNVFATVGSKWLLSRQKRSLTASLRQALMRRLHRLSFAFHDQARAGALQNKFIQDVNRFEELQHYLTEAVLMQGTTLILVLVIVGLKSPWFLLVIAAVVPLNLLVAKLLWARMKQSSEDLRKAETGFLASLSEVLSGLRLTRAHAVERFTEERLGHVAGEVAYRGLRYDVLTSFFGSSAWAISTFLSAVVMGVGVAMCAWGLITKGDFLVFTAFYGMAAGAMGALVLGMPVVAAASDSMTSLRELFTAEAEEDDAGKRALTTLSGAVALRGVYFRYPTSERHSLAGIDIDIPAGGSLALVGPSGSGKSTVASLILGLYEPQGGAVTIDGQDLDELDRRSLRRHVGVVSQDVVMFHETVIANIAWGDHRPDEARVIAAAQRANADAFIRELPQGYHTKLGDRGIGLSGGQRQRLAIARALYRDPKLLILDEATSALDPESERLVQQALDTVMRGRTTLIIAHRLSTVRNADRIAVLDEGRVVETGTYDALMEKRGAFHRLAVGQLA